MLTPEMLVLPALIPGLLVVGIRTLLTLVPAPVPTYLVTRPTDAYVARREAYLADLKAGWASRRNDPDC